MRLTTFERLAVTLVGAIALAASIAARAPQETENFNQTVAFPATGTLELHNFSGQVHITGTSGKDLVIKAVRHADRDRLDHIKIDVRTSGSGVTIEANKRDSGWQDRDHNVVDTDFEIQVPAAARVEVDVFSSDIDVKGVSGQLGLTTFSGDITLDAAAAGATPRLSAKTFSGDIRARLAEGAKGDVNFDSFSGRFDSDLPLMLHSSGGRRNTSMSATLPGGTGSNSDLNFKTFSGNVRLIK